MSDGECTGRIEMAAEQIHLWQWRYTDDFGKRRTTRYLLTDEDARVRLKNPEKVEHSLEVRRPDGGHTSDFQKREIK